MPNIEECGKCRHLHTIRLNNGCQSFLPSAIDVVDSVDYCSITKSVVDYTNEEKCVYFSDGESEHKIFSQEYVDENELSKSLIKTMIKIFIG